MAQGSVLSILSAPLAFLGRMLQAGCVSSQGLCFSWHSQHPRGVCYINDRERVAWLTPSGVGSGMGREAARYTGRDERAQSVLPGTWGRKDTVNKECSVQE